jgi:hypothetical protein
MKNLKRSANDQYSEREAAEILGITISRLHELLDEHVFNEGSRRPASIEFASSDLLLLNYWQKNSSSREGRVLQMPNKKEEQ